jgi:hypothetical protein
MNENCNHSIFDYCDNCVPIAPILKEYNDDLEGTLRRLYRVTKELRIALDFHIAERAVIRKINVDFDSGRYMTIGALIDDESKFIDLPALIEAELSKMKETKV